MSRFFTTLAGSLFLAILIPVSHASETDILDLHYGEVLFHFYQEDYFTSLSHLIAAQDRSQITHHKQEAQLLLGGLQLSYGLSQEADNQFRKILDSNVDPAIHNRVWYYLGKYAYQQGQFNVAEKYLTKINDSKTPDDRATHILLKANTLMMLNKNNEAANILATSTKKNILHDYLLINKGIAQLRAGHISSGQKTLDTISEKSFSDEELKSLRDQANLGLGFQLIRNDKPEQALRYLHQVRLHGSSSQEALLASGWALSELGRHKDALTPWLALGQRNSFDIAVQEANLAIPYAFEKLNNNELAIVYYTQAIDYFLKERETLSRAVNTVKEGSWKTLVSATNDEQFGNWLTGYTHLETIPAKQYLTELLAGHAFQASISTYRDLTYLQHQRDKWQQSISLFHDIVEARNSAYQERVPATAQKLESNEISELSDQLAQMEGRYQDITLTNDLLGLASERQITQWQTIQALEERIQRLPASKRLGKKLERLAWLKGVLFWQLNAQYKQRLWDAKKSLNQISITIKEGMAQHTIVAMALENTNTDFSSLSKKIETIEGRITAMQSQLENAVTQSSAQLESLILKQLQIRAARIDSYLTQARYSLARNHDLLSGNLP